MDSDLLSLSLLICERSLTEADGVMSAIRMVDVVYVMLDPSIPVEKQQVMLTVIVLGKTNASDRTKHSLQLQLIRPEGQTTLVPDQPLPVDHSVVPPALITEAPRGFGLNLQIGVVPRQMGTHWITVLFDGQEKGRVPFTLLERKPEDTGT